MTTPSAIDPAVRAVADKMHRNLLADLRLADKLLKAKVKRATRKAKEASPAPLSACDNLLLQLNNVRRAFDEEGDAWMADEDVRKVSLIGSVTVGLVIETLNGIDQRTFVKYLLMLLSLAVVANFKDESVRVRALDATLEAFKDVQNKEPGAAEESIRERMADEIEFSALLGVLVRLTNAYRTVADMSSLENLFSGTKIGNLAKEISSELDLSGVDMSKPEEFFNFANLMSSNSPLPNIVAQVGSKIQSKIQSGEMKQEDLFAEAMGLMKTMDLSKITGMCPEMAQQGGLADLLSTMTGMMGGK